MAVARAGATIDAMANSVILGGTIAILWLACVASLCFGMLTAHVTERRTLCVAALIVATFASIIVTVLTVLMVQELRA